MIDFVGDWSLFFDFDNPWTWIEFDHGSHGVFRVRPRRSLDRALVQTHHLESSRPLENGVMTSQVWVMTPFFKGHGDSGQIFWLLSNVLGPSSIWPRCKASRMGSETYGLASLSCAPPDCWRPALEANPSFSARNFFKPSDRSDTPNGSNVKRLSSLRKVGAASKIRGHCHSWSGWPGVHPLVELPALGFRFIACL